MEFAIRLTEINIRTVKQTNRQTHRHIHKHARIPQMFLECSPSLQVCLFKAELLFVWSQHTSEMQADDGEKEDDNNKDVNSRLPPTETLICTSCVVLASRCLSEFIKIISNKQRQTIYHVSPLGSKYNAV